MLTLTRRPGEGVVFTAPDGTRLVVSVVGLGPGRVKLGVVAPKDYGVNRNEVQERIDEEHKVAAKAVA